MNLIFEQLKTLSFSTDLTNLAEKTVNTQLLLSIDTSKKGLPSKATESPFTA